MNTRTTRPSFKFQTEAVTLYNATQEIEPHRDDTDELALQLTEDFGRSVAWWNQMLRGV